MQGYPLWIERAEVGSAKKIDFYELIMLCHYGMAPINGQSYYYWLSKTLRKKSCAYCMRGPSWLSRKAPHLRKRARLLKWATSPSQCCVLCHWQALHCLVTYLLVVADICAWRPRCFVDEGPVVGRSDLKRVSGRTNNAGLLYIGSSLLEVWNPGDIIH